MLSGVHAGLCGRLCTFPCLLMRSACRTQEVPLRGYRLGTCAVNEGVTRISASCQDRLHRARTRLAIQGMPGCNASGTGTSVSCTTAASVVSILV